MDAGRQDPRASRKTVANMGAYLSTFASAVPTYLYATLLSGQYKIPNIYCRREGGLTNTTPVDAYRGAGRPEATYPAGAADRQGGPRDWASTRRHCGARTSSSPTAFPYQTPVIMCYDAATMTPRWTRRLELIDYAGFARARRKLRRARASCAASASPATSRPAVSHRRRAVGSLGAGVGLWESADGPREPHRLRRSDDRLAQPRPGPRDHLRAGGGRAPRHAPIDQVIDIVHGDTDKVQFGMGTYGSRSACGGRARPSSRRSTRSIAKAKKIAAAPAGGRPEADIEFKDGAFSVAGTDKSDGFGEVALAAYVAHNLPDLRASSRA
jgi:carbon-monoxide dehydrogenase large subunit